MASATKKGIALAMLSCLLAVGSDPAWAGLTKHREYEVKAAFIYNFAKFVDWPREAFPDPASPIVVGVLGFDPFGSTLDRALRNKTAQGRSFVVRRFKSIEELEDCHILFISGSENKRLDQILQQLDGSDVLTIGETEGFARVGGIINFIEERNRIRFEINIAAAERGQLRISARLLLLAKIVKA